VLLVPISSKSGATSPSLQDRLLRGQSRSALLTGGSRWARTGSPGRRQPMARTGWVGATPAERSKRQGRSERPDACAAELSTPMSSATWKDASTPTTAASIDRGNFQAKATKSGKAAMV
jgi:hypothetical protein